MLQQLESHKNQSNTMRTNSRYTCKDIVKMQLPKDERLAHLRIQTAAVNVIVGGAAFAHAVVVAKVATIAAVVAVSKAHVLKQTGMQHALKPSECPNFRSLCKLLAKIQHSGTHTNNQNNHVRANPSRKQTKDSSAIKICGTRTVKNTGQISTLMRENGLSEIFVVATFDCNSSNYQHQKSFESLAVGHLPQERSRRV